MNNKRAALFINVTGKSLFLLALAMAVGQAVPPARAQTAKTSPGLLNEWLVNQEPAFKAWDLGLQSRVRQEFKWGAGIAAGSDFRRDNADDRNYYFLYRLKPHLGYSRDWFGFYVEGRHSGSLDDDRGPRNPEADPMDLHQAYLNFGDPKAFPLTLKVGRQELSYGEERLVGAFAWNNIGRVFDAAKLTLHREKITVDAFASMLTIVDQHNLNYPNNHDWFFGAYATWRALPTHSLDLFFLSRNAGVQSAFTAARSLAGVPSPRDIYTCGLRLKSAPGRLGGWDYAMDLMGQFGGFNDPLAPGAKRLRHEAYAAILQAGYTFKDAPFQPRLGLEYAYATGDGNATDGRHGTFENLFPTNHKFYGYMDMVSLQNIHNLKAAVALKPVAKLKLTLDYHAFWLARAADHFYAVSGARRAATLAATPGTGYGINPGYSPYVGSEIDLVASYALHPAATLEAGYGHFFRGRYLRQTFSGAGFGSRDADYLYLQASLNF